MNLEGRRTMTNPVASPLVPVQLAVDLAIAVYLPHWHPSTPRWGLVSWTSWPLWVSEVSAEWNSFNAPTTAHSPLRSSASRNSTSLIRFNRNTSTAKRISWCLVEARLLPGKILLNGLSYHPADKSGSILQFVRWQSEFINCSLPIHQLYRSMAISD